MFQKIINKIRQYLLKKLNGVEKENVVINKDLLIDYFYAIDFQENYPYIIGSQIPYLKNTENETKLTLIYKVIDHKTINIISTTIN